MTDPAAADVPEGIGDVPPGTADRTRETTEDLAPMAGAVAAEPGARAWRGPSPRRWLLFALIAIGVVVADQLSKSWLASTLQFGEAISVLGDWLNFVHWRNDGALFGLLPQSAPAFALVSLVVVVLIVVYHKKAGRGIVTTVALALLLGGAIGNLIDRLRWGYVLDWIDMGIGDWRFYTYNIADAAITVSIIGLILIALVPKVGEWGADG
jgi:signal peptidase II